MPQKLQRKLEQEEGVIRRVSTVMGANEEP